MNKELIISVLFSCLLSSMDLYAMEEEIPYKYTNKGRIEEVKSLLTTHHDIINPTIIFPALSDKQFSKLTSREQAFVGGRAEGLKRFNDIIERNMEYIHDSEIEQARQQIQWAIDDAKKGWNAAWSDSDEELDDYLITAVGLQQKMEALRAEETGTPLFQKGHRRTQSSMGESIERMVSPWRSQSVPLQPDTAQGTIALLNKRAPKPSNTTPAPLRRALSGDAASKVIAQWRELSDTVRTAAASAFTGPISIPNPEEFSGESSDE